MAERRPLVVVSGEVKELPSGDTLPAGGDLPAGGTDGQVLTKQSGTDYDVDWEAPSGSGVPAGGTTGQILSKASESDFDTQWVTCEFIPTGGDSGQVLTRFEGSLIWSTPAGGGGTVPLNSVVAATDNASVDHANKSIVWNWSTLSGATGFELQVGGSAVFSLTESAASRIVTIAGSALNINSSAVAIAASGVSITLGWTDALLAFFGGTPSSIGSGGDEVNVSAIDALTFSDPPTAAECAALRDALTLFAANYNTLRGSLRSYNLIAAGA